MIPPGSLPQQMAGKALAFVPEINLNRELQRVKADIRQASASPHSVQKDAGICVLPADISSRFGRRLREIRLERRLTQMHVAVNFGIDRSFISDVERGRKAISLPFLDVLALGMQISLSELLRDL